MGTRSIALNEWRVGEPSGFMGDPVETVERGSTKQLNTTSLN